MTDALLGSLAVGAGVLIELAIIARAWERPKTFYACLIGGAGIAGSVAVGAGSVGREVLLVSLLAAAGAVALFMSRQTVPRRMGTLLLVQVLVLWLLVNPFGHLPWAILPWLLAFLVARLFLVDRPLSRLGRQLAIVTSLGLTAVLSLYWVRFDHFAVFFAPSVEEGLLGLFAGGLALAHLALSGAHLLWRMVPGFVLKPDVRQALEDHDQALHRGAAGGAVDPRAGRALLAGSGMLVLLVHLTPLGTPPLLVWGLLMTTPLLDRLPSSPPPAATTFEVVRRRQVVPGQDRSPGASPPQR